MNANRAVVVVAALYLSGASLLAAPNGLQHVRIVAALKPADYTGPYKEEVLRQHNDVIFTLDEQGIDRFYVALRSFQAHADGSFLLKAPGVPSIRVTVAHGSTSDDRPSNPKTWVFGKIDPADLLKVKKDVWYTPVPGNQVEGYDWSIDKGVGLKLK